MDKIDETKLYIAAAYLRISKDDGDKEESDSISNQRDLIRDFIKDKTDIILSEEMEMIDDGYSGANLARPAFLHMIEAIKAKKANCVIVKDLSRFGRDFAETGKYIEQIFPFLGVRFIAINDNIDSVNGRSHNDNIIIPFKNLINDAYCRDISIKIRSQFEVKRKKGDFIGAFAAYGYLKDTKDKNKLIIDDFAAAFVRNIFDWKLNGMSQQGIADKLNELGVLPPMDYKKSIGLNYSTSFKVNVQSKWTVVAIGRILKNELYVGTLIQGRESTPNHKVKKRVEKPEDKWIRICNNHEAIISAEDFRLVNELLAKDTRISPHEDTVYLFSGLILCADCRQNMIRKTVTKDGKKYIYYICSGNKINKTCSSHNISHELIQKSVTEAILSHIAAILDIERAFAFIDTLPLKQEEIQKLDKQIIKKQNEINRYKELKLKLFEAKTDGLMDSEEYQETREMYSKKIADAETAVLRLKKETEKILSNTGDKNLWIEQFKRYRNFTELTRVMVVSLIDEIIVHEKNRVNIRLKYNYDFKNALNFIDTVGEIAKIPEANTFDTKNWSDMYSHGLQGTDYPDTALPVRSCERGAV